MFVIRSLFLLPRSLMDVQPVRLRLATPVVRIHHLQVHVPENAAV